VLPASWAPPSAGGHDRINLDDEDVEDYDGEGAPLFTPVAVSDDLNTEDVTRERSAKTAPWDDPEFRETIRNLFVTGQWTAEESAAHGGGTADFELLEGLKEDDDDDDDEPKDPNDAEYGAAREQADDDDREAALGAELQHQVQFWKGVQQQKKLLADEKDPAAVTVNVAVADDEEDMAAYRKKKLDKKRTFDSDYDKMNGMQQLKEDMKAEQSKLKEIIDQLPAIEERVKTFGYYEGLYVRVVLEKVPSEFLKAFDPRRPLVIGGLLPQEEKVGVMYMRIKKHRWYPRLLKSNDPLTLSIGWRRFQTMPIFATEDSNGRHRYLKYTPQHMHCVAVFWGPVFPPNTGVMCFQNIMDKKSRHFRPAATGYIMQAEKSCSVVKKIRLTGVACKIHKNTCFIKNMFNSPLEVAKFEGAKLKTVSGIRGSVKKALPHKDGVFRAVFEDKILMSDIINLRTWKAVSPEKYYNPVADVIAGASGWRAMRTQNELRKLHGVPIPNNWDSYYSAGPAVRDTREFKPLQLPRSLIQKLPFHNKEHFAARIPKKNLKKSPLSLAVRAAAAQVFSPQETSRKKLIDAVRTEMALREKIPHRGKLLAKKMKKKEQEQKEKKLDKHAKERKKRKIAREHSEKAGEGLRKFNASKRKGVREQKRQRRE